MGRLSKRWLPRKRPPRILLLLTEKRKNTKLVLPLLFPRFQPIHPKNLNMLLLYLTVLVLLHGVALCTLFGDRAYHIRLNAYPSCSFLFVAGNAGHGFTPHVITVAEGEILEEVVIRDAFGGSSSWKWLAFVVVEKGCEKVFISMHSEALHERKEIGSQRMELMVEESIYMVSVNSRQYFSDNVDSFDWGGR
ncbi:hypothetical protein POTOM_043989 [Populus tomentosa]|uniref:Uncharacterized protein n=1 Tax=Populus tomentosa TaxID=118781 RepID=A0A8X7YLH4_POPTO|nr:hypothetical protein POTOM_043989 [Populus tomentosa]